MELRLLIIFTFTISLYIIGHFSSAEGNLTPAADYNSYENFPFDEGSGESNFNTTYDDEDGFNGDEDLGGDYYGTGETTDDALYDYEIEEDYEEYEYGNGDEWEGFDGMTCSDGTRIGKEKICDGNRDCFDCSDEENCTAVAEQIFMCYGKDAPPPVDGYSYLNPKCIALQQFCDGLPDCANGLDERKSDPGFKCVIKEKFRTCNLPDALICDDVLHCEDETDRCKENPNPSHGLKVNGTSKTQVSYSRAPDGFFRCLNSETFISVQQVCDGKCDCFDLSDECLCEVQRSSIVEEVCGGLCAMPLWSNQPDNKNCEVCAQGEIYWNTALGMKSSDKNENNEKKNCFTPSEVVNALKSFDKSNQSQGPQGADADVIECFDPTLGDKIRARKCDNRPECLFGQDECGINCGSRGNKEWVAGSGAPGDTFSDPPFCKLLDKDHTFACLSWLDENGERKQGSGDGMVNIERRISVCDGVIECPDGSDEAFCPMRFKCSQDSNDHNVKTFDESQRCDGFWHCPNGEDELQSNCSFSSKITSLPCDTNMSSESPEFFDFKNLLDGKKECSTGADECPPFLSQIPDIRKKFYEGVLVREQQYGISSHDKAIDNLPLQVFLIAAAFIGVSALFVSFALGVYNVTVAFSKFCKSGNKDRSMWVQNCLKCAREIVVHLGITAAKILVCLYFGLIRMKRSEDVNYSFLDLKWRSSRDCGIFGAVLLIGAQVPIFTLAFFAAAYLMLRKRFFEMEGHRKISIISENGRSEGERRISIRKRPQLRKNNRVRFRFVMVLASIGTMVAIWLPLITLALLLVYPSSLYHRTQTYGWVTADAVPTIFRANLLDQENAATFASTLVALRNTSFVPAREYFSFAKFQNFIDSAVPAFGTKFHGSYGYFAHSGACLPAFLVHANGGETPFDMAVSNSWTWGLSVAILAVDFVLIFFTAVLTTRYGAGVCKPCCCGSDYEYERKECQTALNHTFSRFVLIESLTWLFIISIFFLNAVVPESFSDYSYTTCCFVVLGINCGIVTPFVLLTRKFRLLKTPHKSAIKLRPQSLPDATRIIEINEEDEDEDEEEEKKPLKNGSGNVSPDEYTRNSERHGLVIRVEDETKNEKYLK